MGHLKQRQSSQAWMNAFMVDVAAKKPRTHWHTSPGIKRVYFFTIAHLHLRTHAEPIMKTTKNKHGGHYATRPLFYCAGPNTRLAWNRWDIQAKVRAYISRPVKCTIGFTSKHLNKCHSKSRYRCKSLTSVDKLLCKEVLQLLSIWKLMFQP